MSDLSQEDWVQKLASTQDAVILDVRTREEIEEGFIPNALHLDIYMAQEFMDGLNKLDKTKTYFVYCRSGNRSGQACAIMNSVGIENAYNLLGGFNEWEGEVAN